MKRLIPAIAALILAVPPAVLGQAGAELQPPALSPIEQVANTIGKVTWTFDKAQEKAITGFIVERDRVDGTPVETISGTRPPDARSFTDEKAPLEGVAIYRVTVMGATGPLLSSNVQPVHYIPKIPAPTGLKLRADENASASFSVGRRAMPPRPAPK